MVKRYASIPLAAAVFLLAGSISYAQHVDVGPDGVRVGRDHHEHVTDEHRHHPTAEGHRDHGHEVIVEKHHDHDHHHDDD